MQKALNRERGFAFFSLVLPFGKLVTARTLSQKPQSHPQLSRPRSTPSSPFFASLRVLISLSLSHPCEASRAPSGSRDGDYDDHACWVCGKKTESRCLPCSEREFDFFFCSREHQKLVWKHHKRVCGDGFFRNPLLSPEEAKLAQRIHHVPAVRNVEGRRDSLADLLHELGHPHPQHKVLIDSLVEGSKRGPTTKLEDLTLSTIRASFGGLSALTDVLTRAKNDLVVDTVWSIIAMLQFQVFFGIGIGNLTVGTEWPPWYSPFQHRVLTLLSLISSIKKSPQSTFLERYADNAAVQSSSFLEQVVEPSMYGGDECKAFLYELLNAVCDFEGILGLARSK